MPVKETTATNTKTKMECYGIKTVM